MRHRVSRTRRPVLNVDSLEHRLLLATIRVNSAGDATALVAGVVTLREAIELADGTLPVASLDPVQLAQVSGPIGANNTIDFDIPGGGVQTIRPIVGLPAITSRVTVDGYTQPGSHPNTQTLGDDAALMIVLDGTAAGPTRDGLFLDGPGASQSVIQGLVFESWGTPGPIDGQSGGQGIFVSGGGGNVIRGNFFGTDAAGAVGVPNARGGIAFVNSTADVVGGADPASRNVLFVGHGRLPNAGNAGNAFGIYFTHETGAVVQGNYIGVGATGGGFGTTADPGTYGINLIDSSGNTIGGAAPGAGNVISSVFIGTFAAGVATGGNVLEGNTIGVDAAGRNPLPGQAGVVVNSSTGNTIGGSAAGTGNLIASAAGSAVTLYAADPTTPLHTVVAGNTIGSDPTGASHFLENVGVLVESSDNLIGGADPASGNRIFQNRLYGVQYASGTTNNPALFNTIGSSGAAAISSIPSQANAPVLKLVAPVASGSSALAAGVVSGAPGTTELVQIYADDAPDANGQSEGQTLLTTLAVTVDPDGLAPFHAGLPLSVLAPHRVVTATATGPTGDTSQFAARLGVGAPISDRVTAASSTTSTTVGRPVTLGAVVGSAAAYWVAPRGAVVFVANGRVVGAAPVGPSGTAFLTTTDLGPGPQTVTAVYTGDGVFPATFSVAATVTVHTIPPAVIAYGRSTPPNARASVFVTFSSAMDPRAAGDPSNYRLVPLKRAGKTWRPAGAPVPATVRYDAATRTATITPQTRLRTTVRYQLTLNAQPPTGLADQSGTPLDGGGRGVPGVNFVATV